MSGYIDWDEVDRPRGKALKPAPPPAPITTPTFLAARVDYLQLAYRVVFDEDVLRSLRMRANIARDHGAAAFELGACVGRLKASKAQNSWHIDHAEYRVFVQERAPGQETLPDGEKLPGWNVEVIFSGVHGCMFKRTGDLLDHGRRLADAFGKVKGERLRRIDLCADIAGWTLAQEQATRLVKRPRAGLTVHADRKLAGLHGAAHEFARLTKECELWPEKLEEMKAAERRLYAESWQVGQRAYEEETFRPGEDPELGMARLHGRRSVTGFTVCPGGDLMCRIYDKIEEMSEAPERARCERLAWKKECPPGTSVTRVEFQIRGEALRDLGLRDPRRPFDPVTNKLSPSLADRLGAIWRYCLGWTRFVSVPSECPKATVRLTRCPDALEWTTLYQADFGSAPRAGRRRLRSGATAEQTVGCMLSMLGNLQLLPLESETPEIGHPAELEERLFGKLDEYLLGVRPLIAQELVKKRRGCYGALQHLAVLSNSARARFVERAPPLDAHGEVAA